MCRNFGSISGTSCDRKAGKSEGYARKIISASSNASVFDTNRALHSTRRKTENMSGEKYVESLETDSYVVSNTEGSRSMEWFEREMEDLQSDLAISKQNDSFSEINGPELTLFFDAEESHKNCPIVEEETDIQDAVQCVKVENEPQYEMEDMEAHCQTERNNICSIARFLELGDMLVKEGNLLVQSRSSGVNYERMTDVVQNLSVEMSALKLIMRNNARQSKYLITFEMVTRVACVGKL